MRITIDRSSSRFGITPRWPAGEAPPDQFVLWELVFWVALARIATRVDVRPLLLTAPGPPADREAYRDYLGVAVQRGAPAAVTFSRLDADRPFLTADEAMWRSFEPELRRRLSELDEGASVTERVRAVLLKQLPAGDFAMQTVARHLAVSTRTLQRRLYQEQTTFQAVLKATRESLARHYLARSTLPAAEISFLFGYEDATSFYRAFHGWTGQTPQRVRAGSGSG